MSEFSPVQPVRYVPRVVVTAMAATAFMAGCGGKAPVPEHALKSTPVAEASEVHLAIDMIDQPYVYRTSEDGINKHRGTDMQEGGFSLAENDTEPYKADFQSNYRNGKGLPIERAPKLREVIEIDDRRTFNQTKHPKFQALVIYNGTEKPVDLTYVRFAAASTRNWLASVKRHPTLISDGIQIEPTENHIPHFIRITREIPKKRESHNTYDTSAGKKRSSTEAFTFTYAKQYSDTFIRNDITVPHRSPFRQLFDKPKLFELYAAMGTELCQGLANIHTAILTPGLPKTVSPLVQRQLPSFRTYDPAQEDVCNRLGDFEAASYLGGLPAVNALLKEGSLISENGHPANYLFLQHKINYFQYIKQRVQNESGYLNYTKGSDRPTVQALR